MFMYLLETANIMFLLFIRFELLSFEHGNPICGSLLGCIQVFLHPDVLDFLHINFPHILPISGKPYLIVHSLYVYLKDRKAGWK